MRPITGQFKVIAVFTLILSLATTVANGATLPQRHLFYSQYYLLQLVTDFELYRNGQGQNDVFEQLTEHLKQFRVHFDPLTAGTSELTETDRQALAQQWKELARSLSALLVTVRQGGFIDQEIGYQYREQTSLFWRHLHGVALARRNLTDQEHLVLLLQSANLRYMEPLWRLAPHEETSLVDMAAKIDSCVSALPNPPEEFEQKWPLLHRALQQDNRSMSFLVNRYSSGLVSPLLDNLQNQ